MNVFNPSDKTRNQPDLDDDGVKRCFIVAIAEGVSEHNGNLGKLLNPLDLQNIKYSVAFDLKCESQLLVFQVMLENIVVSGLKEGVGWMLEKNEHLVLLTLNGAL